MTKLLYIMSLLCTDDEHILIYDFITSIMLRHSQAEGVFLYIFLPLLHLWLTDCLIKVLSNFIIKRDPNAGV